MGWEPHDEAENRLRSRRKPTIVWRADEKLVADGGWTVLERVPDLADAAHIPCQHFLNHHAASAERRGAGSSISLAIFGQEAPIPIYM